MLSTYEETNTHGKPFRKPSVIITGIIATIAVIATLLSVTIVPPRNVGVVAEFGKPVGTLDNGLHFVAPWKRVHDMDGTIQNNVYSGEDGNIDVRLANNSMAGVDVSVRWRLKTEGALEAFVNYKDADLSTIQSNVIGRNLRSALNAKMGSYNPLSPENLAKGVNGDSNDETFLKLLKTYKVVFAGAERRYNILTKMHSKEEASEAVKEQREKEAGADVLIEFITSGYNTMEYRIVRNTPNLPVDALTLLCDGGNLCFGYRTSGDVIIINTD